MAQAVSCWPHINTRVSPCGICSGQSGNATGLYLFKFFSFPLSISFHQGSILTYHLGMNNRPLGGRSSETQPQPIYINNSTQRTYQRCVWTAKYNSMHLHIHSNSVITNATGPRILFDIAIILNTREHKTCMY
jgi:hypothetical protein